MTIYRPIKSTKKTQGFGENQACLSLATRKVKSKVNGVCPPGFRDLYLIQGLLGHTGEDWSTWYKEPCHFPAVIEGMTWTAYTENDKDGGLGVDVYSDKPVELDGRETNIKLRFWHLAEQKVYDGQPVVPGQLIGLCDSTGASSGNHLHWSLKRTDASLVTLDSENGYRGAIDFKPWFKNVFIQDIKETPPDLITQQKIVDVIRQIIFAIQSALKGQNITR